MTKNKYSDTRITKTCLVCGTIFTVQKNVHLKGKGKVCSLDCKSNYFSKLYKNRKITWGKRIGDAKRGQTHTLKSRLKISKSLKRLWKNKIKDYIYKNDVTYAAKHIRIYTKYGHPKKCEHCGYYSNNNRKIHWCNISGKYLFLRSDWKRLCVPCHKKYDLLKTNRMLGN